MTQQRPIEKLRPQVESWTSTNTTPIHDILPVVGLLTSLTAAQIPLAIANETAQLKNTPAADPRFLNALDEMLIMALSSCAERLNCDRGHELGIAISQLQCWSTTMKYIEPAPGRPVMTYLQILNRRAENCRLDADGAFAIEAWLEKYPIPEEDRISAVDTILTEVEIAIGDELLRHYENCQEFLAATDHPLAPKEEVPSEETLGFALLSSESDPAETVPPWKGIEYSSSLPIRDAALAARDSGQISDAAWCYEFDTQGLKVTLTGDGKYAGLVRVDSGQSKNPRVISLQVEDVEFKPGETNPETGFIEDWFAPVNFKTETKSPKLSLTVLLSSGRCIYLRSLLKAKESE